MKDKKVLIFTSLFTICALATSLLLVLFLVDDENDNNNNVSIAEGFVDVDTYRERGLIGGEIFAVESDLLPHGEVIVQIPDEINTGTYYSGRGYSNDHEFIDNLTFISIYIETDNKTIWATTGVIFLNESYNVSVDYGIGSTPTDIVDIITFSTFGETGVDGTFCGLSINSRNESVETNVDADFQGDYKLQYDLDMIVEGNIIPIQIGKLLLLFE